MKKEKAAMTNNMLKETYKGVDPIVEKTKELMKATKAKEKALLEDLENTLFNCSFKDKNILMTKDCHINILDYKNRGNKVVKIIDKVARCIIEEGEIVENVESKKSYIRLKIKYLGADGKQTQWISSELNKLFSVLKSRGFIIKKSQLGEEAILSLIDELNNCGMIESKKGHQYIGIYVDNPTKNPKIISEYLKTDPINNNKLKEALITLDEFIRDLTPEQQKIAVYMFLHQLTAPFNYVRKQLSYSGVTALVIYGESSTGKTTIANATTYMYQPNKKFIEIENQTHEELRFKNGHEASTPAQFEDVVKATTLPIIIDEAETIIKNSELSEMMKRNINSTIIRKIIKKDRSGRETPKGRNIPILITNEEPTEIRSHKGETRRFRFIEFKDTMRITDKNKIRAFNKKWKISDTGRFANNTPLKRLWIIGAVVYAIIESQPAILQQPTIQTSKDLFQKLYQIAGLNFEESIFSKVEPYKPPTLDKIKKEEDELIIDKLKDIIARSWQDTQTEIDYDEKTSTDVTIQKPLDLVNKLGKIAKTGKISWLSCNENKKFYYITAGFLDVIKKELDIVRSLEGLAETFRRYTGDSRIKKATVWISNLKKGKTRKAVEIPKETMHALFEPKKCRIHNKTPKFQSQDNREK